jgi:hypothetical protein
MNQSNHARLANAGWTYRTNVDRGWIIYCDPATGLWHSRKEALTILEARMESQWSDRCDDPRVAPHLQTLADRTFAAMLKTAITVGVPVTVGLETMPFDMMDSRVGNTFKACIAEFLVVMMPPAEG